MTLSGSSSLITSFAKPYFGDEVAIKYLISEDFTEHNTPEELASYLQEKQGEINAISRKIHMQAGRALLLAGGEEEYAQAQEHFEQGLETCDSKRSSEALGFSLEISRTGSTPSLSSTMLSEYGPFSRPTTGRASASSYIGFGTQMARRTKLPIG